MRSTADVFRLALRRSLRVRDRCQPDHGVEQGGGDQCLQTAEVLEQIIGGENRPDDSAERVGGIEDGHRQTSAVVRMLNRTRGSRKRPSHQQGRNRKDDNREQQPDNRRSDLTENERTAHGQIQMAHEPEKNRRHACGKGHTDFQKAIYAEWIARSVDATPDEDAAQAQPPHEYRQHCG